MIKTALNRPVTVLMCALGACLLGYISWDKLAVQLVPQLVYPEVFVGAGLPGGSPEEVERQLAIPVEGEIAMIEGVRDIATTVSPGFFSTRISFDFNTDMKFAVLKLQQRMTALEESLPENTRIGINKFDTSDLSSYLMQLSIRGNRSLEELREIAERRVQPKLEKAEGVVNVFVAGGQRKSIGIIIDQKRCEAVNLPVPRVQSAINRFHRQTEHLGQVQANGRTLDVNLVGRLEHLEAIKNIVVHPTGPIRLRDVAEVDYNQEERTRIFRVNGKSGVSISVQKDNVSNMLQVSSDVLAEVALLQQDLADEGLELVVGFNQAELIQEAIDRVKKLALTGAFLALIVLYLFLRNARFVAILMLAIPVSLLGTANFMYSWDLSINIVSLCGLALAIGMLVDNSIVVLENIFSQYQKGMPVGRAIYTGTKEVSRSIFAATTTTILVFLPVLFMESEARLFVRELALSVIFPLAVSLVVALTVIPLLAQWTLARQPFKPNVGNRVLDIYRLLLKSAIRHRIRTISAVVVLFLISIFIGVTAILKSAPTPPSERVDLYLSTRPGSTLQNMDEATRRFEDQVLALPDIEEVRTSIQAEEAHIRATFKKPNERTEELKIENYKEKLRHQNRQVKGVELSFDQPQTGGGGRSSGGGGGLAGLTKSENGLRLRGFDMAKLRVLSEQIRQTLRTMEDVERRSVRTEFREGAPEVQIVGDRLRLAVWGLTMQDVMTSVWQTRSEGARAATPFYEDEKEYTIQLLLKDIEKRELQDLSSAKVLNASGQYVPVSEVARVRIDEGPGNIIRHNQERQVKITWAFTAEVEASKARLEGAQEQIDRLILEMRLPRGFTLEKLEADDKQTVYYWMLGVAGLLIFMFLAAQFESFYGPFVILGTIPTAIIGALLALVITGTPLSLGEGAPMALLGLVVLLGIAVNNGIILLDRIAILRSQYGYRWQRAVITAAQNRVRPILMTSATTILGIFPLALKEGTEFEIWPPFAITVLGGLSVSALSTLVFIPVLYVGLEQTKEWLKKIGAPGLISGSLLATAMLYWFHTSYESALYTSLMALPLWFGILGLFYAVLQFFRVKKEKARIIEESLTITIRNLTKIYGIEGRFMREWHKGDRKLAEMKEQGELSADDQTKFKDAALLHGLTAIFITFLFYFFESTFWILVLTLVTMGWAFKMRNLYYQWRIAIGRPIPPRPAKRKKPKTGAGKKRRLRRLFFRKASKTAADIAPGISIQNGADKVNGETLHGNGLPDAEKGRRRFRIPRLGGFLICGAAIALFTARTLSFKIAGIFAFFILLVFWLRRIARKIENGEINPDMPAGRFRRLKRGWYAFIKVIPFIQPPKPLVTALKGVNLKIGKGMFGLLGPNGAGKTTLMRTIVGVLEADRGSIFINGRDLFKNRELYYGAIGYLPQDFGLYENMTPLEFLNYHALLNGIYEEDKRRDLIEKLLQGVGLSERKNDKVGTFSGGMKQRVGIAQTLLNLPQIIVVDEPTAGLDPRERIRFRNLLSELAKDRIVIFSTHIVEDIASTCHDIAVLKKGHVIYRGSPTDMASRAQGKVFEAAVPEHEFSEWRQSLNIIQHSKVDGNVKFRFISPQPVEKLAAQAVEPNLEDAYVVLLQEGNGNHE